MMNSEVGDTCELWCLAQVIAGVQDMRFQELMPDPLHWVGITRIDRFISMSDMKYDAIVGSGIEIVERVDIPEELIPADAKVEIDAKMCARSRRDLAEMRAEISPRRQRARADALRVVRQVRWVLLRPEAGQVVGRAQRHSR